MNDFSERLSQSQWNSLKKIIKTNRTINHLHTMSIYFSMETPIWPCYVSLF